MLWKNNKVRDLGEDSRLMEGESLMDGAGCGIRGEWCKELLFSQIEILLVFIQDIEWKEFNCESFSFPDNFSL